MPSAKKSETVATPAGSPFAPPAIKSSVGSVPLTGARPTGWPTCAVPPSRTPSTNEGPISALNTEIQSLPHSAVAALAGAAVATLTPASIARVEATANTLTFRDGAWVDGVDMMVSLRDLLG